VVLYDHWEGKLIESLGCMWHYQQVKKLSFLQLKLFLRQKRITSLELNKAASLIF